MSINKLIIDRIGRNEIDHMSVSLNITLIFGLLLGVTHGATISLMLGVIKEISDSTEIFNLIKLYRRFYNGNKNLS